MVSALVMFLVIMYYAVEISEKEFSNEEKDFLLPMNNAKLL